jgi:hypothetical protein
VRVIVAAREPRQPAVQLREHGPVPHDRLVAPFLDEDGRLRAVPRRRGPLLAVLDTVATEFQPGLRYSEDTVNTTLSRFHPDYCLLRRLLVDEEFLDRRDGTYWRIGGTFEVD